LPEFFRDWAESAFCPDDADRKWLRLRSEVQKFQAVPKTVAKVRGNSDAGSRFDGWAAFVAGHPSGAQLGEIAKIIDSGKLAPIIDRILPLSEARRAHELSQSGHTHGKIALRVKNEDGTLKEKQ
jgi:hypothetical protein